MPTLYTENSEKWKSLADIDYFTQFVKAWIPFNAWYKNYYPQLDSDRKAIDEIKSTSNKVRDRLISLLNGSDTDSLAFKSNIAKLHNELERKFVYNKYNEKIGFNSIVVEKNPNKVYQFTRSRITYKVERGPGGRKETEFEVMITASNGSTIFSYTQTNGYDLNDLKSNSSFSGLSSTQQASLESCYKEVNPRYPINLLTNDDVNSIKVGSIKFTNDTDKLCKGIFEILYYLRNALFHGMIVPDKDTNRVYEPAYSILNALIQVL